MQAEMQALRTDMQALEQRMTIRLGGLIVVGVSFLTVLDKLF